MKYLVTGGYGFIGSNYIHHVLGTYDDVEVVNLDALTYAGNPENVKQWEGDNRYRFVQGDICDTRVVEEAMKGVDVVVHFAAESHVDRSIQDAGIFVKTNVLGTHVLLEAARKTKVKRFHHISTDEVFGALEPGGEPFNEETSYAPRSPYSASKAGSDHLVRAYYETYGLPITISNCSNNYGPYHFPEKLIPLTITNIMERKKVPVYGQGAQIRDWLYVTDHCNAIDKIVREGQIGETYCVGGDNQSTNLEVVRNIVSLMGVDEDVIEYVTDRPGHDFRYDVNHTKITRELGWAPTVDLGEGLVRTVAWYRGHETWWKRLKEKKV